jgi:hypothetical protein
MGFLGPKRDVDADPMPLVLGHKLYYIEPHPEDRRHSTLWLRWVAFERVGVIAMVHAQYILQALQGWARSWLVARTALRQHEAFGVAAMALTNGHRDRSVETVFFLAQCLAEGSGSTMADLVSISWPGHPWPGFVSVVG